jgi:hypothetical protein
VCYGCLENWALPNRFSLELQFGIVACSYSFHISLAGEKKRAYR